MAHADVIVGLIRPGCIGVAGGDFPQDRERGAIVANLKIGSAHQVHSLKVRFAVRRRHFAGRIFERLEVVEAIDGFHLFMCADVVLAQGQIRRIADMVGRILFDNRLEHLHATLPLA